MKIGTALLPLLLAPCVGGCSQPPGMYQNATIRMIDSQLCFSVADSVEARRTPPKIAAISVSELVGTDWEKQWSWITPLSPKTTLNPDDCIPYGFQTIGDRREVPLQPLRQGRKYHVSINSEISNPSPRGDRMLGRMYSLDFCLVTVKSGAVEALIVPSMRGITQWQVCETGDL